MNRSTKALLCLGLLGLASAQSSVVSVFIPDTDPQPLVASIIGNDATATTYSITCPASADECGMGPGMRYTGGPKTAAWTITAPGISAEYDCSVGGTTTAVCRTTASGSAANFPGVGAFTFTHVPLIPVTVTAGSVTSVTGAPATAAGTTAASAATTGQTSGAESTAASSQAASGSSMTAASTGGLPAVTGNAGVVGAVAIAVAAAVL